MFKILKDYCTPKRGTKYSAYVDLFSAEDVTIEAGETKVIKLGVKLDLEKLNRSLNMREACLFLDDNMLKERFSIFLKSHYLEVALRSSLAVKGLIIANGIGIIDLDYPDEIGLIVYNPILDVSFGVCNGNAFKISKGDKVAQCTLKEHKGYLMGYESNVVRISGFGSTGKR